MFNMNEFMVYSILISGAAWVSVAGTPATASAISWESADQVGECEWPNVVGIGKYDTAHCTGVVLAKHSVTERQFILTAAHCVNFGAYKNPTTGELGMRIKFGEHTSSPTEIVATVDLIKCHFHPATQISEHYPNAPMWNAATSAGVEMVACEIDPMGEWPDVPTVPIMSPEGALRDHLRHEVYYVHNSAPWKPKLPANPENSIGPDITVVGTGKYLNNGSTGSKRALDIMLVRQFDGTSDKYSNTTLETNDKQNSAGEIEGFGIAQGDSGSPEFYQAPDGTWRLVALHHTSHSAKTYAEAVPTRLLWVENLTGDQTPCHNWSETMGWQWVGNGNCTTEYPKNIDTGTGTWDDDCKADLQTGGAGGWGELWGPVSGYDAKPPVESGNGPWIAKAVLAAAYNNVLALANQGEFGTSPSEATLAEVFYQIGEPVAFTPFLEQSLDTGNDAVYLDRVLLGDFDGDLVPDHLIVQPMHNCGKGRIVEVIDDVQTAWHRDIPGIIGNASCGDYFGASAAIGDFNGDGYDDVVIGVPGDDVGTASHAGSISVIYGSSTGLTASGDQNFHQDSVGISGSAERWDFLGESIAVGDFNCDGYDDVAIGAPQEDIGSTRNAGAVNVIYGSATGLSTVGDDYWYQGSSGVLGTAESGDRFGASLAAGNFNDDINSVNAKGCDDLAIGSPSEDLGSEPDAGHVTVLYGGVFGLTTTTQQEFYQGSGLGDSYEAGDLLGSVLAAGDMDDDGIDDLWVQAGGEQCGTSDSSYGHQILLGSSSGLSSASTNFVCEDSGGAYATSEWANLRQLSEHYARAIIRDLDNPPL